MEKSQCKRGDLQFAVRLGTVDGGTSIPRPLGSSTPHKLHLFQQLQVVVQDDPLGVVDFYYACSEAIGKFTRNTGTCRHRETLVEFPVAGEKETRPCTS